MTEFVVEHERLYQEFMELRNQLYMHMLTLAIERIEQTDADYSLYLASTIHYCRQQPDIKRLIIVGRDFFSLFFTSPELDMDYLEHEGFRRSLNVFHFLAPFEEYAAGGRLSSWSSVFKHANQALPCWMFWNRYAKNCKTPSVFNARDYSFLLSQSTLAG